MIIKKIRTLLFKLILFILSILVLWFNINLYPIYNNAEETKKDILLQLNYLDHELKHNHLGNRMQQIFPEGFVFTNALYGLTWCEIGLYDSTSTIKSISLKEALYAYNEINSEKAKSNFDQSMIPEHGIFYLGWKNYLLAKILMLDTLPEGKHSFKIDYEQNCEKIISALDQSESPYLESYPNQSWPADMTVAIASVSIHKKLLQGKYNKNISKWIVDVKSRLDMATNLIPHQVNTINGTCMEGARGSSISLILRLLTDIDSNFAHEQFSSYKKYFVSTTFGLPSINEYPKGSSGVGDIDSGPVVFGVGFAGTIVSVGTLSCLGEIEMAQNQFSTINAFGFGYTNSTSKKYMFGLIPISDAFISWSRTSLLNDKSQYSTGIRFLRFHLISLGSLALIWAIFFHQRIRIYFGNMTK